MISSTDSAQSLLSSTHAVAQRSKEPAGIAASIWAPQPQPSEVTWPKTLDTFSRVAEKEMDIRPRTQAEPGVRSEDIFGAFPSIPRSRDVGAIGDGRKKNSPGFDETHVEQLLRTLELNSPTPFMKKPNLSLELSPSSPDFSPASATSSLMTPTDLSPTRSFDPKSNLGVNYDSGHMPPLQPSSLLFDPTSPNGVYDGLFHHSPSQGNSPPSSAYPTSLPSLDPYPDALGAALGYPSQLQSQSSILSVPRSLYSPGLGTMPPRRFDHGRSLLGDLRLPQGGLNQALHPDWLLPEDGKFRYHSGSFAPHDRTPFNCTPSFSSRSQGHNHEPINFLSLLHPSSSPPYHVFVERIIKSSDQQASIFLQQKLKVADYDERAKIVDAICARGFEMMAHRFGNWAVQRCLEAASTPEERRKIIACMRGRVVELATNCYGCHVLQKALDCEEDIRLLIVSELLLGDPAQTLVNKHASHVWSKIMELSWTPPAPPIFAYVNKSLRGKWAALACHETGSLVVQHAFENLEAEAKDGIVEELIAQGPAIFADVVKNQWGSYCIQHILEHGSDCHRDRTLQLLLDGLLEFATHEQGSKSVTKALKEGGKSTLDKIVSRMCEPAKGSRRAMIVDLALSVTGSQLIASVLPTVDKDQRSSLYECIRGHIVTLRGCKTGSKVIWLFDRMVMTNLSNRWPSI